MEVEEPMYARERAWQGPYQSGQRITQMVLNILDPDNAKNWSWWRMERLLMSVIIDSRRLRIAREELKAAKADWEEACALAKDAGDTDPYFRRKVNYEYIEGSFTDAVLSNLVCKHEDMGDVAGAMGRMDILDPPPPVPPGIVRSDLWIMPWLQNDGRPTDGVLYGGRGSGKSDFAMSMAQMAVDNGRYVMTNIPVYNAADPKKPAVEPAIYNAFSMRDMVVVLSNIYKHTDDKRVLFIMDETGTIKATQQRQKMTRESKAMQSFHMVARKFGIDFLWIIQDLKSLASELRSVSDVYIRKSSKKTGEITTNGSRWPDLYVEHLAVGGIKATTVPFGTRDFAPFSMEGAEELMGLCRQHRSVSRAIEAALSHFGGAGSSDRYCVLCDKEFVSPKGLTIHYHKVHRPDRAAKT